MRECGTRDFADMRKRLHEDNDGLARRQFHVEHGDEFIRCCGEAIGGDRGCDVGR